MEAEVRKHALVQGASLGGRLQRLPDGRILKAPLSLYPLLVPAADGIEKAEGLGDGGKGRCHQQNSTTRAAFCPPKPKFSTRPGPLGKGACVP